ncbi:MAG: helix-turn-helix transcriptional regulator [Acidimicrobiaceae bacterium]|nr:helix-turn-helix transcriptional regulator [Acidimicrobiaceae bacterium]
MAVFTSSETSEGGENSLAVALGLLGDEWNLLIIRMAFLGARRFKEWHDKLGIANSVLSSRLNGLIDAGVLVRVPYQKRPLRHEYRLTECGKDLWQVLLTIWDWESKWVSDRSVPLPPMVHLECGNEASPILKCAKCKMPASVKDVRGAFGPSGSFERSIPRATTRRRSVTPDNGDFGLYSETISLIGNRWSATALAAVFFGASRFTDFLQLMTAPPLIVADRLKTFCDIGVLQRAVLTEGSSRLEYRLSPKGHAVFPMMLTLIYWGDQWFRSPEGPALVFTHLECKNDFIPTLYCSACDHELTRKQIGVGGFVL